MKILTGDQQTHINLYNQNEQFADQRVAHITLISNESNEKEIR